MPSTQFWHWKLMMTEQIKDALSNIAIETFEQLAFMFGFSQEAENPVPSDSPVFARISFSGYFCGTLVMKVSSIILEELAANMLGVDEEEKTTMDQQHDALKETLNIICGNLLPVVAGKHEIFNINLPEIVPAENMSEGSGGPQPVCCVNLAFDVGQCKIVLFVDGKVPDSIVNHQKGFK